MEQRDKFATYKSRKDFGNNVHEKEVEMVIFGLWLSGIYIMSQSEEVCGCHIILL
jgi:hypothetical protein